MKATLALSWQTLLSRVHPPLPVSPREKQKLLALIQTSFQRHLDKETATGGNHTREHLQSVLTSPLFSPKRTSSPDLTSTLQLQGGGSLDGLQDRDGRPLTVFKEQISKGTASLLTAKLCLDAVLQQCTQPNAASTVTAMAGAGVSPFFLNWLWSSGMAETGSFLKDSQFVNLLTSFLVAEQRYEVILQWLSRLSSPRSTFALQPAEKKHAQAVLLLQMVKAECDYGAGVEGAMMHFVQNFKRNEASKRKQNAEIFNPAGLYLSEMLSEPNRMSNASSETVDAFISCTERWSHRGSLFYAFQRAFHPTQPSTDLGVKYLERFNKEKALHFTKHKKLLILRMSLRIADLFVERDELAHASAILHFIGVHFAEDVGVKKVPSQAVSGTSPAPNQDENLRLLETLVAS